MVRWSLSTVPAAMLALALPLTAQWVSVPAAASPPNRSQFTLTPLPNGELLLFGGDVANPLATEWSWDGIRWTPLTTPVPRRQAHAMARDEGNGSLVLFGGAGAAGALSDTWVLSNGVWSQAAPATSPAALQNLSMAYDPRAGGVVLTGRSIVGYETWRFDGTTWTSLAPLPIGIGQHAALFTDAVRGELCAFISGAPNVEVQRLVAGGWSVVASLPTTSALCAADFDRERGRAVATGFVGVLRSTFEYDGLSIQQLEGGAGGLSTVPAFAIAYHAARHETVEVEASTGAVRRHQLLPVPMAATYGTACVDPAFQLDLVAGDSPQPGASHRLRAAGSNATSLTLSVLGLSHVTNAGLPLPQPIPLGALACQLRVEALLLDVVGVGLPAQKLVTLANSPALLGARYDAQFVQFDASGVTDASNGVEVQIGRPLPENVLLETFATAANRDPVASGDTWGNGSVAAVAIGGDGRHGSFDASFGTALGGGVFEWSTDFQSIPATNTLDGVAAVVAGGQFFFTDFVVPAGITVRFVGSSPARVLVRGRVDVQGTVQADAADMPGVVATSGPLAGQRVSQFFARGGSVVPNPLLWRLGSPAASAAAAAVAAATVAGNAPALGRSSSAASC